MIRPTCKTAECPYYADGAGSPECAGCPGAFARGAVPRSCHACKWNGRGLPVCISCPGPAQVSNAGVAYVHIDAAESGMEMIEHARLREPTPDHDETRTVTADLSADTENALRIILAELVQLDPVDREIFFGILGGRDTPAIGAGLGVTKQAVCARIGKMGLKRPLIGKFIKSMMPDRDGVGGGANRGKRRGGFRQLEMDF